jgi:hypothetical protein
MHAWPGTTNSGVILASSVVFTNRRQHRMRHLSNSNRKSRKCSSDNRQNIGSAVSRDVTGL